MSRRHWSWWRDGRKWVNEGVCGCKVVPFESEWCPGTDDHGVGDLYWGPPVPWQQLRQGGQIMLSVVLYYLVCACIVRVVCVHYAVCCFVLPCVHSTFTVWVVYVRASECTYVCVWASAFRISLEFNMELIVGRLQQQQPCCLADAVYVLCWSCLLSFADWLDEILMLQFVHLFLIPMQCAPLVVIHSRTKSLCLFHCWCVLSSQRHSLCQWQQTCSALQQNHWRGCTMRWRTHTCFKTFHLFLFSFFLTVFLFLIWSSYHDQKN